MTTRLKLLIGGYALLLCLYTVFSYSLTAPNLILTSWAPYWNFQLWMWETFFNNRPLLTYSYGGIITALVLVYGLVMWEVFRTKTSLSLFTYGLLILPLILSNNALSYDVFNYIFNAKMVVVFHANPHVQVALDFAYDDWTRFMHNTHTQAPYGYGWTVVSLVPYLLGMGKFLPTWLLFRLFSVLSIGGLIWATQSAQAKRTWSALAPSLVLILLNPLFLLEIITNSHNDLWMMAPAIAALAMVSRPHKKAPANVIISLLWLAFSISIKFATLLLVPLWLVLVILPYLKRSQLSQLVLTYWPLAASVLMMVPLLTSRSQQFHPWYLTWVIVWIPVWWATLANQPTNQTGLAKLLPSLSRWWLILGITLSVTSLYRYVPYLWVGEHTAQTLWLQKVITWSAVPVSLAAVTIWELYTATTTKRSNRGR